MRPMIAVSVLSATRRPSFSGLPARMLAMRSACSCTYGFGEAFWFWYAFSPVMQPSVLSV